MYSTKQNLHSYHGLKRKCTPSSKTLQLHQGLKRTCTQQSKTSIQTKDKSLHVPQKAKLTFTPLTKAYMYTTEQN